MCEQENGDEISLIAKAPNEASLFYLEFSEVEVLVSIATASWKFLKLDGDTIPFFLYKENRLRKQSSISLVELYLYVSQKIRFNCFSSGDLRFNYGEI